MSNRHLARFFANALRMKSNPDYVLLIAHAKRRANTEHCWSNRCHGVTLSVMAAEVYQYVFALNYVYLLCNAFKNLTKGTVHLETYVRSQTVLNFAPKDGTTIDRIQIKIICLKQSYGQGQITKFGWNPGSSNQQCYACIIKGTDNGKDIVVELMTENMIEIEEISQAENRRSCGDGLG